jgi:Fe-S-cluster containining protein
MFIGLPIKDLALRMEGKEPYSFEMRKIDGKCFFLHGNQCSIYGLRPLLCKFYPFSLETDGNGKFRFQVTSECPGLGTGLLLKKPYYERLFNEARFQHGIEE